MRREISTNTASEKRVGYSRAVLVDDKRLYVSGTVSVNERGRAVGSDVYSQAKFIFQKIDGVLRRIKFSKHDVVLVTAYITDMRQITGFDRAFKEYFAPSKPGCTLVGAKELVTPELLVEIGCTAEKASQHRSRK